MEPLTIWLKGQLNRWNWQINMRRELGNIMIIVWKYIRGPGIFSLLCSKEGNREVTAVSDQ